MIIVYPRAYLTPPLGCIIGTLSLRCPKQDSQYLILSLPAHQHQSVSPVVFSISLKGKSMSVLTDGRANHLGNILDSPPNHGQILLAVPSKYISRALLHARLTILI